MSARTDVTTQESFLGRLDRVRSQAGIKRHSQQSQRWYINKLRALGSSRAFRKLQDEAKEQRTIRRKPNQGYMYTYRYQPKHAATLPYWDRYPLILMLEAYSDGFLGLNLHYCPPKLRATLLDTLMEYMTDKDWERATRFGISYQLVKGYPIVEPLLKRYLYSHITSNIVMIPSNEWEGAIFLPLQQFQKKPASFVWSQSVQKAKLTNYKRKLRRKF